MSYHAFSTFQQNRYMGSDMVTIRFPLNSHPQQVWFIESFIIYNIEAITKYNNN